MAICDKKDVYNNGQFQHQSFQSEKIYWKRDPLGKMLMTQRQVDEIGYN